MIPLGSCTMKLNSTTEMMPCSFPGFTNIHLFAPGTNPASAQMAGMKVVPIKTSADGAVDMEDIRVKVEAHRETLACIMITYPSTNGVFESSISSLCEMVH